MRIRFRTDDRCHLRGTPRRCRRAYTVLVPQPSWAASSAAIGMLDLDRLGMGFGTETTRLVVDYAFGSLALERLEVAVLEINERALRCYRRCGFRETERVQGAAIIDGQSFDDIVMQLRKNDAAQ